MLYNTEDEVQGNPFVKYHHPLHIIPLSPTSSSSSYGNPLLWFPPSIAKIFFINYRMKPYYNLSLSPGAHNVYAIAGNFSDAEDAADRVIVGHGEILSLFLPDPSGKNCELDSISVATSIRSLARLHSSDGNLILVGLDTGGFVSVQYSTSGNLEINTREHFDGPVQFLSSDCRGRAIMIVPRKQNKFFYIAHEDGSPLDRIEVQDSNTITYAVAALGREDEKNLCFAAIELNCSEDENPDNAQTHIAYYDVRFEGNIWIERSTVPVNSGASLLLAVPGGVNGPGGILVCTKNMVIYKKRDFPDASKSFPGKDEGALIVSATTCHHHQKYGLFYLLQTEFGNIFRVSLILADSSVAGLDIEHFDTIPVTYAMCLLDSGLLFAASKTGNHALYQLLLPDGEERDEVSSLKNLSRIDQGESILEMEMKKFSEEKIPHILTLCHKGPFSYLRKLSPGMKTYKIVEMTLRAKAIALWRMKKRVNAIVELIAISFENETQFIAMCIEDGKKVILKNPKFDFKRPTLAVSLFGNGSMLQVHSKGITHVTKDPRNTNAQRMEGEIVKVAYNRFQLVLALRGRKLLYYTVDSQKGYDLLKVRGKCRMPAEVACLCLPQVPEGKNRSVCLAVGLIDGTIVILVLHPRNPTETIWKVLSVLNMLSPPEWLSFISPQDDVSEPPYQFLIAGLLDGLLITMVMVSSGRLWVLSSQCLGSTTPKLFSSFLSEQKAIVCLSDRPWIGHMLGHRFLLTPLSSCEALDSVASICCQCPKGLLATAGDRMTLFRTGDLEESFSKETFTTDFTPKKFVLLPEQDLLICISNKKAFSLDCIIGNEKRWASRIVVLDPMSGETISKLELQENETAHSLCTVNFDNMMFSTLLAVGIGNFESPAAGFIRIYRLWNKGKSFMLLGNTKVEGVPQALCPFKGALLAGIGPVLIMYDLGGSELSMRCKTRIFPDECAIVAIYAICDRIYVSDTQEVVRCFEYRTPENQLYVIEYGNIPRSVTTFLHIDSSTMAWADKFGNVFFVQFPSGTSDEVSDKVEEMCFHAGDIVTCLQKASLVPGGDECIVYVTVTGTFGALLPLVRTEDVESLSGLEKQMRREYPPLCNGSDRNNEYPTNCVIDGDICEAFQTIGSDSQRSIAGKLGTTEIEILRKLGATRNKII